MSPKNILNQLINKSIALRHGIYQVHNSRAGKVSVEAHGCRLAGPRGVRVCGAQPFPRPSPRAGRTRSACENPGLPSESTGTRLPPQRQRLTEQPPPAWERDEREQACSAAAGVLHGGSQLKRPSGHTVEPGLKSIRRHRFNIGGILASLSRSRGTDRLWERQRRTGQTASQSTSTGGPFKARENRGFPRRLQNRCRHLRNRSRRSGCEGGVRGWLSTVCSVPGTLPVSPSQTEPCSSLQMLRGWAGVWLALTVWAR